MVMFKRTQTSSPPLFGDYKPPRMGRHYSISTSFPGVYENRWMTDRRNPFRELPQSMGRMKFSLLGLFMLLPWIPYSVLRSKLRDVESRLYSLHELRQQVGTEVLDTKHTIYQLEDLTKQLHEETKNMYIQLKGISSIADSKEYEAIEKEEDDMLLRIDGLQQHLQSKSRDYVKEKYGRGPYRIVIDLDLENQWKPAIIVELQAAKEMPLALHLFLDMVKDKLWEGLVMINRDGVLSASPPSRAFDESLVNEINQRQLVFSETNTNVERGQYSLCFSGHGPSFYISLKGEATKPQDPCFGKINESQSQSLVSQLPEVVRIAKIRFLGS